MAGTLAPCVHLQVLPYLYLCCLTSNYVLFQPFHLWHIFPGFSFALFLRPPQKAASLNRAFLLKGFIIRSHLLSGQQSRVNVRRLLLPIQQSYQFINTCQGAYKTGTFSIWISQREGNHGALHYKSQGFVAGGADNLYKKRDNRRVEILTNLSVLLDPFYAARPQHQLAPHFLSLKSLIRHRDFDFSV